MTCPRCSFENPASKEQCFRCGVDLDFLARINVVPTYLTRSRCWSATWGRCLTRWTLVRARATSTQAQVRVPTLLSLMPGLGHLWLGEKRRALCFHLGWWVVFVFCQLWSSGGSLFAWLPFQILLAVHGWCVTDAYRLAWRSVGRRSLSWQHMLIVSLVTTVVLFSLLVGLVGSI